MVLPKYLTTVTSFSKYLAMFLFVVFPFLGFYIGLNYQKNLKKDVQIVNTISPTPIKLTIQEKSNESPDYWKNKLLLTKEYNGKAIGAFVFENPVSEHGMFFLAPVENMKPDLYEVYTFSIYSEFFNSDGLFDIVDNKMYVLDQKKNILEIYSLKSKQDSLVSTITHIEVNYIQSIKPPPYNVGTMYAVKCAADACIVQTAFHQEAGCTVEFSIKNNSFSIPTCIDHSGTTFTPDINN